MKDYKIETVDLNGIKWTDNGNGIYLNRLRPGARHHIMDFFGVEGSKIHTIIRKTDNASFSLGEFLDIAGRRTMITNITFDNKVIKLNNVTHLNVARKWVNGAAVQAAPQIAQDFFKVIEEKLEKERPIRLSNLLKKNIPATLEEFLIKFYTVYNNEDGKDTIYIDDKLIQTENGRRRTIGDLYLICHYYFPSCTLKEVANILINILPNKLNGGYRSSWCNQINRRTYYFDTTEGENGVFDKNNKDEFGYTYAKWLEALRV